MIKYVLWCSICCALRVNMVTGSQHPTLNKTQTQTDMNLTCNHNSSTVQWWYQKKHMFMIGFSNGTCFNTNTIPWFIDCDCNVPNYSCSITINALTIELLNNTVWKCSIVIDGVDFSSNEITLLLEEQQASVLSQNQTQQVPPDDCRLYAAFLGTIAFLCGAFILTTTVLLYKARKYEKKEQKALELSKNQTQTAENRRQYTPRRSVQADNSGIGTSGIVLADMEPVEPDGHRWTMIKAKISSARASQSISHSQETEETVESVSDQSEYPTTGKGYVLIINFTEDRRGCENDLQDLLKFFQTTLKYEVRVKTDLTLTEVRNVLNDTKTTISKNYACFVFIIMGHGNQNGIETETRHLGKLTDEEKEEYRVKYSEIRTEFTNKKMTQFAGLPKLIFINSCRGPTWQETFKKELHNDCVESDGPIRNKRTDVGTDADMFIFHSSVHGHLSARDKIGDKIGSYFIQLCCQVFEEKYRTRNITDLATEVNGKLQDFFPSQTSEFISTMRYPFYWTENKGSGDPDIIIGLVSRLRNVYRKMRMPYDV